MRNYWIDKKTGFGRKITVSKVKNVTDLFHLGRIETEDHELLYPISAAPADWWSAHANAWSIWVPKVGDDVLVVEDKYYISSPEGGRC